MPTRFIELAGEINQRMPEIVVDRVASALNEGGKPLKNAKVLVVGIAYKPDVDDIRETPAAAIIEDLHARGASVQYHDPHIAEFPEMRKYDIELSSVPLTTQSLDSYDAVLIVTNHTSNDWDLIAMNAQLVIDTRNALSNCSEIRCRLVKA